MNYSADHVGVAAYLLVGALLDELEDLHPGITVKVAKRAVANSEAGPRRSDKLAQVLRDTLAAAEQAAAAAGQS